ncbi:DMT family transporter [Niallia circulans]|uniref:DMT family transporter n=1 Tax=Niallia circulans TaxID=1397 RepID=A0A553SRE8_NIACI|nr:DMT family transporter [Niallia circulans]TRZ39569.1 DMT family transporter [Niallia circulans]
MGIFMVFFTLLGGIMLSAQLSINGTLSRKAGTIETTLLTCITGTLFLFIMILFFSEGNILKILEAPKWQLAAVFLGTFYGLFTIVAVSKIGVIASNIAVIAGQLLGGIVIDNYGWFNSKVIPLDFKRFLALLFMLTALYFIYKGNKQTTKETSPNAVKVN